MIYDVLIQLGYIIHSVMYHLPSNPFTFHFNTIPSSLQLIRPHLFPSHLLLLLSKAHLTAPYPFRLSHHPTTPHSFPSQMCHPRSPYHKNNKTTVCIRVCAYVILTNNNTLYALTKCLPIGIMYSPLQYDQYLYCSFQRFT